MKTKQTLISKFQDSLPMNYRSFDIDQAKNPGLCDHLFKFWHNPDTADDSRRNRFEDKPGLLLCGDFRTGKTMLACELARRLIIHPSTERSAKFLSMVQWANQTTTRAFKCELDSWVYDTIHFSWGFDQSYLILDDFDKLRVSNSVQPEVFNLIEQSTANGVTLIVTTNCTAEELVSKFDPSFGGAIVSRLSEFCIPINVGVQFKAERKESL